MSEESECVGFGEGEEDIRRKSTVEYRLNNTEAVSYEGRSLEIDDGSGIHFMVKDKGLALGAYHPELTPFEIARKKDYKK